METKTELEAESILEPSRLLVLIRVHVAEAAVLAGKSRHMPLPQKSIQELQNRIHVWQHIGSAQLCLLLMKKKEVPCLQETVCIKAIIKKYLG